MKWHEVFYVIGIAAMSWAIASCNTPTAVTQRPCPVGMDQWQYARADDNGVTVLSMKGCAPPELVAVYWQEAAKFGRELE